MKQFTDFKDLIEYIVKTTEEDYCDGFYKCEQKYDNQGRPYIDCMPLVILYNGIATEFFGGVVPFANMAASFKYKNVYFRVCKALKDNYSRISWAPNEGILFDECWCIEIPVDVYNICYIINSLL